MTFCNAQLGRIWALTSVSMAWKPEKSLCLKIKALSQYSVGIMFKLSCCTALKKTSVYYGNDRNNSGRHLKSIASEHSSFKVKTVWGKLKKNNTEIR